MHCQALQRIQRRSRVVPCARKKSAWKAR
jgi:hypothetical protein